MTVDSTGEVNLHTRPTTDMREYRGPGTSPSLMDAELVLDREIFRLDQEATLKMRGVRITPEFIVDQKYLIRPDESVVRASDEFTPSQFVATIRRRIELLNQKGDVGEYQFDNDGTVKTEMGTTGMYAVRTREDPLGDVKMINPISGASYFLEEIVGAHAQDDELMVLSLAPQEQQRVLLSSKDYLDSAKAGDSQASAIVKKPAFQRLIDLERKLEKDHDALSFAREHIKWWHSIYDQYDLDRQQQGLTDQLRAGSIIRIVPDDEGGQFLGVTTRRMNMKPPKKSGSFSPSAASQFHTLRETRVVDADEFRSSFPDGLIVPSVQSMNLNIR